MILNLLVRRFGSPGFTLQKRKGKYYVHVKVPKLIRFQFNGQRYLRRSTGVATQQEANRIAPSIVDDLHQLFVEAILNLDPKVEALRSKIEKHGGDLNDWYLGRGITLSVKFDDVEFIKELAQTDDDLTKYSENVTTQIHIENFTGLINALHQLGYHDLPSESTHHETELALKFSEVSEVARQFPDAASDEIGASILDVAGSPRRLTERNKLEVLFSEQLPVYIEQDEKKGKSPKSLKTIQADCNQFIEVVGDLPLREYEAKHAHQFAAYLEAEPLSNSNSTIRRKISAAKGVFRSAKNIADRTGKKIIDEVPWSMIDLQGYGAAKENWRPLPRQMLFDLFNLEMEKQEFIMLTILLTTGMRLDEAALLTWDQVKREDDLLFFDLRDAVVKNDGSKRMIAAHDIIYPCFQKKGKGRLFNYRIDENGKAQNAASKALMKLIKQVREDERLIVVHSLRGNFIDFMRNRQVPLEAHKFMTGHSLGDVSGEYGIGPSLRQRYEFTITEPHPWITESRHAHYLQQSLV